MTVDIEAITSVDPRGGSTIASERINSQLSHAKAIVSVDHEGWELMPPRHSVRTTGWPLVESEIGEGVTFIS